MALGFQDNPGNILGTNTASNLYSSSSVTSDADGSIIERQEYLQGISGGTVTKALTTIANGNTTLFSYTGTIKILDIIGRVTTKIENITQNMKLAVVSDSLSAVDICANVDMDDDAVGTMCSITGTAANAMVATTNGALAPGQANSVIATCTTSGIIRQVAGAANTGAITWSIRWEPVSTGATLTAA